MSRPSFRFRFLTGFVLGLLLLAIPVHGQTLATQIAVAINQLTTGLTPFTQLQMTTSKYINWGNVSGTSGYGFRDNAGHIQVKFSGASWIDVNPTGAGDLSAKYILQVAASDLPNAQALGSLGTALVLNTTTTGVLSAYGGSSCTNQFARSTSAIGAWTCATVSLTADVTGTLPVVRGGTNQTSGTSGGVEYWSAAGTLASSNVLTASAIVLGGGAGSAPNPLGSLGTTTTVLHGNAAGNPTFGAVSLTADVTGTLPAAQGGTGNAFFAVSGPAATTKTFTFPNANATVLTDNAAVTVAQGGTNLASYAIGDLIQASGTTTLAKLASVATGNVLISGGVTTVSSWGKVGLTTHVSGTLPVTNGGTGLAVYAQGDVLYASTTTSLAGLNDVTVGSYLRSGGANLAPLWSTATLPNTATTGDLMYASAANTYSNLAAVAAGSLLRSAGVATAPVWSTTTWPNSATTGDVLYASGSNAYANLADVTAGSYLRSGGVTTAPVWSTATLPNTVVQGDLLSASAANVYANISAVAVGQVLVSSGTGTLPAWSANPRISTLLIGANLALSSTAPTVSSAFGSTPSITAGTAISFRVNVGTGGAATGGVLAMPTATTGWNCDVDNLTALAANRADQRTAQTASSTTTVTVQNQTVSTGAALAWTASDILKFVCIAY